MKKKPGIFREPKLIFKNKKIRMILFFTFNGLSIVLLPTLAILINYPYGYLCWILVICFAVLFNLKAYHIHTEQYPLNNYSQYQFNPIKDKLRKVDDVYVIEIIKISKSDYVICLEEKKLYFDMKGCIFPLTIIRAYLIRQFIIPYINKYKLVSDLMGKNINISKMFHYYRNVVLYYKNGRRKKKSFIIKSYKTKMSSLEKSINGYGYTFWYITYHGGSKYHRTVSEKQFVSIKSDYK